MAIQIETQYDFEVYSSCLFIYKYTLKKIYKNVNLIFIEV